MHSIVYALLVVSLASLSSCAAPLAAPELYPATMAVDFDEHGTDCLSDEVRAEIARGVLRLEDALATCQIERRGAIEQVDILQAGREKLEREVADLRAWAAIAKGSIGAAILMGVAFLVETVVVLVAPSRQ